MITEETIKSIDRSKMWDLLCSFPMHWAEVDMLTKKLSLRERDVITNVCILGMGDSAIAGDVLISFGYDQFRVPVFVSKNYEIPNWVDSNTLLIASSYSGNTEETLRALELAEARGTQPIGITSGGKLQEYCEKNKLDCIQIQGELPSRAALAYLFVPMLRICEYYDVLPKSHDMVTNMTDFLALQVDTFSNYEQNPALDLAEDLEGTLPIIYSNGTLLKAANIRWCHEMHVNAKMLCYGNYFPELTHNEIAGWDQMAHLTGRLSLIYLKDEDDDGKINHRMHITRDLTENMAAFSKTIQSQGDNRLERLFSHILFADWTTFYLALIQEIDPTPITKIDLLKARLAEGE